MWNARMSRPTDEPLVDAVVVAILKKQGFQGLQYKARNLYHPEALFESLEYYAPEHSRFVDMKDPEVKAGISLAYKLFAKPKHIAKLDAVSLKQGLWQIFDLLGIKGEKSAGMTAYGRTKEEAFPVAMRKVREFLNGERNSDPCLAGVRTQVGKFGRLIWGYPLMMTIIEGIVARPMLDFLKDHHVTPMAFGMTSTQLGIKVRKAVSHNRHYVAMDASKFDSSVQAGVITCAFNAFRTWFDLEYEVLDGVTVGKIFDLTEEYFIHTPIVMPTEAGPTLYSGKRHGVPSGSYFTQLVDSFANVALIGTLDFKYKLGIRRDEMFVLGDDMLFFTNKEPNLDKYAEVLSHHYNMRVNAAKSKCGSSIDSIHFLGRDWENGLPYRDMQEAADRAICPERYRKYGEDKWLGGSLVVASYGFTSMLRTPCPSGSIVF